MQVNSSFSNFEMNFQNNADVVIVGGGPTGLLTGILTKTLYPSSQIVILEQQVHYKRNNQLRLHKNSFKGIPKNARLTAMIQELFPKGKKSVRLDTNKIEDILLKHAKELGIHINCGPEYRVENPRELRQKFPNAKVIVGADGAHSKVREAVFGPLAKDHDIQYTASLKYKTHTPQPQVVSGNAAFKRMNRAGTLVAQIPRNNEDGEEYGTMNVLFRIDKATYEVLKDAKFGAPFKLEECPPKFQKLVKKWLIMQGEKDSPVEGTLEVTSIKLNAYSSRAFAKKKDDVEYAVVGDAAFGVPFYRSLNNGIACSIKLAKSISKAFKTPSNEQASFKAYNSFVQRLCRREIASARMKGVALRALGSYIKIVGWMPRRLHWLFYAYSQQIGRSRSSYIISKSIRKAQKIYLQL